MNFDNNAGRLHSLLVKCKLISPSAKCADAWREILGGSEQNSIVRRVGAVMVLVDETYNSVVSLYPHRTAENAAWRNNLRNAFAAQQLNGQWSTFIEIVKQTTIDQLAIVSDLLGSDNQILVEADALTSYRDELQNLLNDVLASTSIDRDIKRYVVRVLNKLLSEIDDYFITGIAPVIDSIESVYGHVVSSKQFREFVQTDSLGSRLLNTLQATANFATSYPLLKDGAAFILSLVKQGD